MIGGKQAARRRRRRQRRRNGVVEPPEQRRLRRAAIAFAIVVVAGFIGYQLLEGMDPLDALYMTVITITTVGFREVTELGSDGKLLTIGLIVAGVGSVSYAAVTAAEFIVEGHLRRYIEGRRMEREISELTGHTIICGFGRVGVHVATTLDEEINDFVIVDSDEDKIRRVEESGYLYVEGDATEEQVLLEAGLRRARAVVAAVNSDADNVLITLTAKGIQPDVIVIARSKADENEAKLRRAGADRVIAPTTIGGRRIAQLLTRPAVADFLEGESIGGVDYSLEEVPIRAGSDLDGATLRDAAVRERYGCTVLAILRDGELDTHPTATTTLCAGDLLVVLGSEAETLSMRQHFT